MSGSGTNVGSVSVTIDGDAKPVVDAFGKATDKVEDFEGKLKKTADAASKVSSRVDELRTRQQQLTTAIAAAGQATDQDRSKVLALRGELERTSAALARLTGAHDAGVRAARAAAVAQVGAAGSSRSMGYAALEASRALEDLQYGFGGVVNNLPGLIQLLGFGAGAAGAVSVLAVGINQLVKHSDEIARVFSSKKQAAADLAVVIRELASTFDTRLGAALDRSKTKIAEAKEALRDFGLRDDRKSLDEEWRSIEDMEKRLTNLQNTRRFRQLAANTAESNRDADRYATAKAILDEADRRESKLKAGIETQKAAYWELAETIAKINKAESDAADAAERRARAVAATARAQEIGESNDQMSRNTVYALGFDAATMTVIGAHAAALVLFAQANGRIGSEFPDPGEPEFNLPPEGLKLVLDDASAPALARLSEPLVLGTASHGGFKSTVGLDLSEIQHKIDAGARAFGEFSERTAVIVSHLKTVEGRAHSLLAGGVGAMFSATSLSGVGSIIGRAIGGAIGGLAPAIAGAVEEAMMRAVDAVVGLVGDQRFSDAVGASATTVGVAMALAPASAGASAAIGLPIATAQFLWAMAQSTKSFQRLQGASSIVVDRLVLALEPLGQRLLPLVGALDAVIGVMVPFADAFAGGAVPDLIFSAAKTLAQAFAYLGVGVGYVTNAVLTAAGTLLSIVPGQGELAASLLAGRVNMDELWAAVDATNAMTQESAAASGEAAASMWDLKKATDRTTTNVPSWYRTGLAEYRTTGGGQADRRQSEAGSIYIGTLNLVATSPSINESLRRDLMRQRGTPLANRGRDEAN